MDLAAPFDISQPAVSKHVEAYERAGLVTRGRDGPRRPVRLAPKPLRQAHAWTGRFPRVLEVESFDALDDVLEDLKKKEMKR